jgi:DNA primase
MFPILDVMDNVLGFSGRATRADQEPKYLNTPETIIFHKGNILYGLEKAKSEIKGQDFAVLVEGQMDVVSSHQASVENAVATSGTALTEDHLRILSRYTQNISLAFDSDDAGQRAAQRAADLALEYGLNVKMIVLPASFKDPGEIASQSPKLWQEVAKSGIHVVDWYFQKAFAPYKQIGLGLDSLSKKTIAKQLLPVIKRLPDPIERDHYIQKLAKNLAVSERTIEEALGKVKESSAKQTKTTLPSKSQISVQKYLLALLLLSPEFWPKETLSEIFTEEDVWQVYKTGQKMYNKGDLVIRSAHNKNTQRDFKQKVLSNLPPNLKTKVNFWLLEAEAKVKDSSKEELQKEINEIINRLENIKREKIKQDFAYKIAQAEEKGEIREMKKLIEQLSQAFKQEK